MSSTSDKLASSGFIVVVGLCAVAVFWWDPGGWQAKRDQHDREVQEQIKAEQRQLEEEPHILYRAWMKLHPTSELNEEEWQVLHKHDLLP